MRIRLASYNLHKCRGMVGPFDPVRNLLVIAEIGADVIALQEVDFRMGARPQALPRDLLRDHTGMEPVNLRPTGPESLGWHGQTVLMRPDLAAIARVRRLALPGVEPRGAVLVDLPGWRLVAVHLGLLRSSRRAQLARLARMAQRPGAPPTVLTGDFNEWRPDRGTEALSEWRMIAPGPSYPAPAPKLALDRIALPQAITLTDAGVHDTRLARRASDHLPIWVDMRLPQTSIR
ncbi:endonuclease/exonuclease/phosphatase family protein [Paracoccus sp. p4-l81]|uniref:endonuclease/exonuclease/phosphatase family protein n=1 Tax=unclassified Paracoccus (in: a-proteobacteria) TaxID=2688777 RepID=UPI0035B7AA63